jgi:hypothetical protein
MSNYLRIESRKAAVAAVAAAETEAVVTTVFAFVIRVDGR